MKDINNSLADEIQENLNNIYVKNDNELLLEKYGIENLIYNNNKLLQEMLDSLIEKYSNNNKHLNIDMELDNKNNFFDYYNENTSINNAIVDCNNSIQNFESSYIIDDEFIPFNKYDLNPYDFDKNKHKKQKNVNKIGILALSAMVLVGSTWINKYFG